VELPTVGDVVRYIDETVAAQCGLSAPAGAALVPALRAP
jgi:hypothetical protein